MTGAHRDEPMARVSINRILEKVTAMEATMAVQACAIQAIVEDVKGLASGVEELKGDRFPWRVIGGMVALCTLILGVVVAITSTTGNPPPPPR